MIWRFAKNFKKFFPLLILVVFSTDQLKAEINGNCPKENDGQNGGICVANLEIINQINEDFQTVYAVGNVTAISQPPLVITPKIAIEAPINLQTFDELEKPEKIVPPLRAKMKPNININLRDIVKVLDDTGSMHLNRCLKKLSDKTRKRHFSGLAKENRKRHFSGLAKEFETLEILVNSNEKETNPVKKLFTQSPSQKDCINYLDFILMAG